MSIVANWSVGPKQMRGEALGGKAGSVEQLVTVTSTTSQPQSRLSKAYATVMQLQSVDVFKRSTGLRASNVNSESIVGDMPPQKYLVCIIGF
jgi:hypothetical protein